MIAMTMFIPVIALAGATYASLRRAKAEDAMMQALTTPRWGARR